MKRFILLILLITLTTGTAWAGVRLDWDDSTGSTTGRRTYFTTSGGAGSEAFALVLDEVGAETQTPSLTFFLPSVESDESQTPSLSAKLAGSRSSARTLDELTFDALGSSSGDAPIVLYEWDADGDGVFDASTASPMWNHAFPNDGVFFSQVRITDEFGQSDLSEPLRVVIENRAPAASFKMSAVTAVEGASIQFEDISRDEDGMIVHVGWDFGDGTYLVGGPSSDNVYSHTFSQPGVYTIEMYVIDNDGSMARAQSIVTVL